jgi:hypothetical protein
MKTWKPTTAGILSIISGVFSLLVGIGAVTKGEFASRVLFHWRVELLGSAAIVLGVIAIVGGIFAIKRKVWLLALAGAICALYPPHVSILGILAIVFVALSKGEFAGSVAKPPSDKTA